MNYQYAGSMAPPWSVDSENFTRGPSWLGNNPVQGVGPWFMQVYNGFEVTDNAPIWYLNYPNAGYMPAWLDGSSQGPWWSSFISESLE